MADLDNLTISVGGDISGLQTAFDQIPAAAETAAAGVQGAFADLDSAFVTVEQQAKSASDAISEMGGTTTGVEDSLAALGNAAGDVGSSFTQAESAAATLTPALDSVQSSATEAGDAVEHAGESAHEAEGGFGELAEQLVALGEALVVTEGLKEFGEEALTAYGATQTATLALTALTHSAEDAEKQIEGLKALSLSDALSFPSVLQFELMGANLDLVKKSLNAAADAGIGTTKGFDAVEQKMYSMALAGNASGKALATLGLSVQDLAKQMGSVGISVDSSAKAISAAFKEMDPTERLEVIDAALAKWAGLAQQSATTIDGAWRILKTSFELLMDEIGKALAPVVIQIDQFLSTTVVPYIKSMVDAFNALPEPVRNTAVALGLVLAAIAPLAIAVGGFGIALAGISAALAPLAEVGGALLTFATVTIPEAVTAVGNIAFAIATGLTGALTEGEAALLAFGVQAGLIGYALVALYNGIPKVLDTLKEFGAALNGTLVPALHDLDTIVLKAASDLSGAAADGWKNDLAAMGPVGDWIQTQITNIPNLTGFWQGFSQAIKDQESTWVDFLNPVNMVNTALKNIVAIYEYLTGFYPSMAAAAVAALNKVTIANDAVNSSLAKQATALQGTSQLEEAAQNAADDLAVSLHNQGTAYSGLVPLIEKAGYSMDQAMQAVGALDLNTRHSAGTTADLTRALKDAETALQNVITQYKNHNASSADVKAALDRVNAATVAAGGSLKDLAAKHITAASAAKTNADAHDILSDSLKNFVGPIYKANFGITDYVGSINHGTAGTIAFEEGIEVLRGSIPALTSNTNAASGATNTLGTVFQTTADIVAAAAAQMGASVQGVTTDVEDATAAVTGFGQAVEGAGKKSGQLLGGVTPGEVVQQWIHGAPVDVQIPDPAAVAAQVAAYLAAQKAGTTAVQAVATAATAAAAGVTGLGAATTSTTASLTSSSDALQALRQVLETQIGALEDNLLTATGPQKEVDQQLIAALNSQLQSVSYSLNSLQTQSNNTASAVSSAGATLSSALTATAATLSTTANTVATSFTAIVKATPVPATVAYSPGSNTFTPILPVAVKGTDVSVTVWT